MSDLHPGPEIPPGGLGPHVVVVEPDPTVGNLLATWLTGRGWRATHLTCGRQYLARQAELSPDVLVTSLEGDRLDGLELVDEVRRFARPPPMVLFTSAAGVRSWGVEALRELGLAAILVRPVRFPELEATLLGVLSTRGRTG